MMSSIVWAIVGGGLIGLAASWLLLAKGRVAGISGVLGELLGGWNADAPWRLAFAFGLLAGGAALTVLLPDAMVGPSGRSLTMVAVAGGLVGFGTQLGSGCTSGHGVCGLSRFSKRSLVATLTFMTTGCLTAVAIQLLAGGSL